MGFADVACGVDSGPYEISAARGWFAPLSDEEMVHGIATDTINLRMENHSCTRVESAQLNANLFLPAECTVLDLGHLLSDGALIGKVLPSRAGSVAVEFGQAWPSGRSVLFFRV
jgi:hypothetical protein